MINTTVTIPIGYVRRLKQLLDEVNKPQLYTNEAPLELINEASTASISYILGYIGAVTELIDGQEENLASEIKDRLNLTDGQKRIVDLIVSGYR